MNEWEFTAQVKSWIDECLRRNRDLPFSEARCEQRGRGSNKRRDLTLLDKNKQIALTGEIKLPFRRPGRTPFNADVIRDARRKARDADAPFYFTWNVNDFVLWPLKPMRVTWRERDYEAWEVTAAHTEADLDHPAVIRAIQKWLPTFLQDFAQIVRGTVPIGRKTPDQRFVRELEAALRRAVGLNVEELLEKYETASFRTKLDRWMTQTQGWTVSHDPESVRENLDNAAKFVFYEALLKRYGGHLDPLARISHRGIGGQAAFLV